MSDSSGQLVEQVKTALAQGSSLNIIGRGSKAHLGRTASGSPLHLADHSGIVDYQPVELVVTARAGTPITEINDVLAEHNQMLSFEPPDCDGAASIGGTLACNLSGPGRPWGGSVRDMLLGIRLINGRGEHLRFGGQVIKNVAGYDASRLQAGAMGTLGVVTEVSLKVMPKPALTQTLVQQTDAAEAILIMNRLAGRSQPLTAACWLDGNLYVRLAGARAAVEAAAAQWSGERLDGDGGRFWEQLREQQLSFFAGPAPLWRFSLKPSAPHFLPQASWLLDWGGAQRWLRGDGLDPEFDRGELEAAAVAGGGQVSLFRGGDRSGEVFHTQTEMLQTIHKQVKAAFDPRGLFNPGRLYSWL
ncbi:glycolate oxidase subunit GlcE [Exilibacterium tricleocarpae]|uniref:Glycolate oxidase subunit GlcE n=1 Tax=Exilibacterium tricleocarpae TaxID=2591008 RepID=A0A545U9A9_9GAMM|nr:glycolate oxidase subunit GlcE [Exilibacterium tricleocarpae]TQV86058.1 glycolate oxidase subunit GlcE [Exilibacterium tricleocarpae]